MSRRAWLMSAVALVAAAAVGVSVLLYGKGPRLPVGRSGPVPVLVAVRDIPVGTSAEEAEQNGSFRTVQMNAHDIPIGSLADPEPLRGAVAGETIAAGGTLLVGQWVQPT